MFCIHILNLNFSTKSTGQLDNCVYAETLKHGKKQMKQNKKKNRKFYYENKMQTFCSEQEKKKCCK